MKDLSMKQNVLQEIIDLMDQKDGESLKNHPKFASPVTEEPSLDAEIAEEEISSEEPEVLSAEAPAELDGLSEEDLQMLLEKFKDLQ